MTNRKSSSLMKIVSMLCLLAIFTFTGCGPGYSTTVGSSGYTELTVKRGIARFSFEYPSHYKIGKVEIRYDLKYTDILLGGQSSEEEKHITLIDVSVYEPEENVPNIQAAIDHALYVLSTRLNFRLLESIPVRVTTEKILGQRIIYSWTHRDIDQTKEPLNYYSRDVFFEHGGLIWEISVRSDMIWAEADKADFEHILQTFKILN